jgi:hypothetical protein
MEDANTILMRTEQVTIWSEDARGVICQWAPELMGISLEMGHFTTEWNDIKVR